MKIYLVSILLAATALAAFADDSTNSSAQSPSLAQISRYFELRTYHAAPGKLEALHTRFRDHTNKLFLKHNMTIIGFWVPMNKDGEFQNTLVYLLAFPSHEVRDRDWKEFAADPEWQKVKSESEKDGKLVEKVDSQFMTATDYSPMK